MKKLLTVLLAIMMCLCLVNLNSNNTKAEEVETKETEKLDEEEVLEEIKYEEAAPAEEEVKEEAVAEGVVAEAAEKNPSNDVWHIRTLTDLYNFFNQNEVITDAVLENDIVITNDSKFSTYSLNVNGNKLLDLNGHDLIMNKTLMFESYKDTICEVRIINSNMNKTSTIRPQFGASIRSLISTRLNSDTKPFLLTISNKGKKEDLTDDNVNKYGSIVFDGMDKSNLAGLLLGTELDDIKEEPNHVKLFNILFKNFNPSDGYGAAVVNVGTNLLINRCEITNSKIGVVNGAFEIDTDSNGSSTHTGLTNTLIHFCEIGIANGINDFFLAEVMAAPIEIANSRIEYNLVGLNLIIPEDELISNDLNKKSALSIYYGTEIYKNIHRNINVENIKNAKRPFIYVDSTLHMNDTDRIDERITKVRFYVDEVESGLEKGSALVKLANELDAYSVELENKRYLLSFMYDNNEGYVVNMPNGVGLIKTSTPAVDKGNVVTISGNIGDFDPSKGEMYLVGPDMNEIKNVKFTFSKRKEDNAPSISFTAKFVPETSGNYRICYYKIDIGGDLYTIISNPIYISVGNPSTPTKDESCEKVIGPTWHWNNTKGVCEEVGVVGTYTR